MNSNALILINSFQKMIYIFFLMNIFMNTSITEKGVEKYSVKKIIYIIF